MQVNTKLLVDADVHSIQTVEAAIGKLRKGGQALQTVVFAPPGRETNKKWKELLEQPSVSFEPVPRRHSSLAEANDSAIARSLARAAQSSEIGCVALLTSDFGFADEILKVAKLGKDVRLFIPAVDRAVIRRYQNLGVRVCELKIHTTGPKVRAFLRQDGTGYVKMSDPYPFHDWTANEADVCESFLRDLGYIGEQREFLEHATAKFWLTNELGTLTVYPPECAIKEVCALLSEKSPHTPFKRSIQSQKQMALIVPKPATSRSSRSKLEVYGSLEARRIFMGGGPFMLADSEEMVSEALSRLGYLDNDMNSNLAEALLVFVNATDNKSVLRKRLDALPTPEDVVADVVHKLRCAFLSHHTPGHWRLAPRDTAVRASLCRQGYLRMEKASAAEVFDAMAKFAYEHGLPRMSTYNGYVFRILYLMDTNPNKTGAVEFSF